MIRDSKYVFRVIKTQNKTGLGLISLDEIKKKDFIIEYFGKKINDKKVDSIKQNKYLFEIKAGVTLDGSTRKNLARYINHSCIPNSESKVVKGRVFIYSKKKIKKGEELTYNYGSDYFNEHLKNKCKCKRCVKRGIKK